MDLLSFLIIFALLATLGALGFGVVSMIHGGEFDRRHSNQLMWMRIGFQGAAVVLLLLALVVAAI